MAKETKTVQPVKELLASQVCNFDPLKDVEEVIGGLAVVVDDMLKTGIVRDSGDTLDNNGIEDPNDIIGRVSDIFDVLEAERLVKKYGKKVAIETVAKEAVAADNPSTETK